MATKKRLDEPRLLPPPRRSGRTAPRSYDDKAWEERSPSPPEEGASLLLGLCAAESPAESDWAGVRVLGVARGGVRGRRRGSRSRRRARAAAGPEAPARDARGRGSLAADAAEAAVLAAYAGADPSRAAPAGAAAFEHRPFPRSRRAATCCSTARRPVVPQLLKELGRVLITLCVNQTCLRFACARGSRGSVPWRYDRITVVGLDGRLPWGMHRASAMTPRASITGYDPVCSGLPRVRHIPIWEEPPRRLLRSDPYML